VKHIERSHLLYRVDIIHRQTIVSSVLTVRFTSDVRTDSLPAFAKVP